MACEHAGDAQIWNAADETATLYFAECAGHIVATTRVHLEPVAQLPSMLRARYALDSLPSTLARGRVAIQGAMWLDPGWCGRTIVSLLESRIFCAAARRGASLLFRETSDELLPLYERLGYRRYGPAAERTDIQGPAAQTPLALCVRDSSLLWKANSPIARWLDPGLDDAGTVVGLLGDRLTEPSPFAVDDRVESGALWARMADGSCRRPGVRRAAALQTPPTTLAAILARGEPRFVAEGDRFFHAVEGGVRAYGIVLEGRIGHRMRARHGWHWLSVMVPGDVFDVLPREANDTLVELAAVEDCQVVMLDDRTLSDVMAAATATSSTSHLTTDLRVLDRTLEARRARLERDASVRVEQLARTTLIPAYTPPGLPTAEESTMTMVIEFDELPTEGFEALFADE